MGTACATCTTSPPVTPLCERPMTSGGMPNHSPTNSIRVCAPPARAHRCAIVWRAAHAPVWQCGGGEDCHARPFAGCPRAHGDSRCTHNRRHRPPAGGYYGCRTPPPRRRLLRLPPPPPPPPPHPPARGCTRPARCSRHIARTRSCMLSLSLSLAHAAVRQAGTPVSEPRRAVHPHRHGCAHTSWGHWAGLHDLW